MNDDVNEIYSHVKSENRMFRNQSKINIHVIYKINNVTPSSSTLCARARVCVPWRTNRPFGRPIIDRSLRLASDDGYRSMEQRSLGGSFVRGSRPPIVALAHPSIASFPLYLNHEAGRTRPSLRCVEGGWWITISVCLSTVTNKHIPTYLHQYIYQSNLIAPCQ